MQELVIFFYVLAAGFLVALIVHGMGLLNGDIDYSGTRKDYHKRLDEAVMSNADMWDNNSHEYMVIMGATKWDYKLNKKGEDAIAKGLEIIWKLEAGRIPKL